MKKLFLTVLVMMSAIAGVAQSNQAFPQKVYYASDYGTWQVQGQTPNTYQFQPSSLCVIPQPAGGNFDAFNVNGPVYIQDAVTANSEVLTPHFVNINATLCNVALTTAHSHYSFALMSGTAGLQEALNTIAAQIPYPTQVILDRNWYTALGGIPGQTATAVIASVKGNAAAILADVTQAPTQFYKWNGSTYIAVAPAGASIPATGGVLQTSGVAGQANASLALPANTTAVTQSAGDSSTKVATMAAVAATNPMTTAGDVIVGGAAGVPTRLPGNSGATQAVLTSTAGTQAGPTTKSCGNASGGAGNSLSCTWSTAPAAGEFIACGVTNGGTNTFTVVDSASNSYPPYGAGHLNSTTNSFIQTFYFSPVTTPVTTTTVTVPSGGSILTILCNSVTGIATSPTDGQAVADATSAPFSSGAITTTQPGDYIFCSGIGGGGSGFSAGTGFTAGAQHSPFFNSLNEYQIQSTAGSITPTMNGSVATGATLMCSAFKAASATPTTTAFASTINIANAQAANTPVIPIGADPTGATDSRVALQAAITTAIAQNRELLVPTGKYIVSCPGAGAPALTAPSANFRMRGSGSQGNVSAAATTTITATASTCTTLQIGPGTVNSVNPGGYLRDIQIDGNGRPGSPTGFSDIQIDGVVQFKLSNVAFYNNDIGLDLINNDYGFEADNIRGCFGSVCNVGIYLRTGSQSGSDLVFINPWAVGVTCGVCVSGGGGGYHFFGGQLGAGTTTINDDAASVIMGKDYLTGAVGNSSADFHGTSFEGTDNAWVFRGYEAVYVDTYAIAVNPSNTSTPALGFYKNTNFKNGQLAFHDTAISGHWAPQVGNALMVVSGVSLSPPFPAYPILEDGTHVTGNQPGINGTSTWVDSMVNQSGSSVQQFATVHSSQGYQLQGGLLLNNNAGTPEWSSNGGTTYTTAYTDPGTTLGDTYYRGATAATRLAGNTSANDKVLVSTGLAQATPLTSTCQSLVGSGTTATCPWSSPPPAGAFISCGAYSSNTALTYSVNDSASNSYTGYSSTSFGGSTMQGFYFPNIGAPITTTTLTASGTAANLTLQCNAATNVATSSPADGSCTGNISSGTPLPCSGAITTSVSGDYLMCMARANNGGTTLSAGTGFTLGSSFASFVANEYGIQAAAGAITPSFTLSGTSTSAFMFCGAFKPGSTISALAPTLKNSPALDLTNMFAGGTPPTITGCGTITLQHGGTLGGDFTTSTAGTCTAVFALPTAPTGWHCDVTDITKHVVANILMQSATSATSCTVTGTTAASDVLSFSASAY